MVLYNDKFYPTSLPKLVKIFIDGLENDEILGLPKELIFRPEKNDFFSTEYLGKKLHSPIGVAAGPHTQMAQNIAIAYLAGARFIELKTVQTLDELEIPKPCIDMQDEGYNVEWSQELKIQQSFDEYLNAWILVHILAHELGFNEPGVIFNMSIGYDYNGIMQKNVQWFLDKMTNAQKELNKKIKEISIIYPKISEINIPSQITDNITLSTMHGCPPDEVEQIAQYLITERKLHTIIKLNPTLLGKQKVRQILKNAGFPTEVPDIAFEHDLKFDQAVGIIKRLLKKAQEQNLFFGIKLTNTLESKNNKDIFDPANEMMYMSGRALHPIGINLAYEFTKIFGDKLQISFSGGVDAFNIEDTLACGLKPITVSSDLLKPGGYGRLNQYYENLRNTNKKIKAKSIEEFILKKANKDNIAEAKFHNLEKYANFVLNSDKYRRNRFSYPSIKTNKPLEYFDCIEAPCKETCPTNQDVPQYMYLVREGRHSEAFYTVMQDNPFPTITGYSCDHTCQYKCTRINYDSALNIREIKRFIAEYGAQNYSPTHTKVKNTASVGIIGGGVAGLSAAFYLKLHGFDVEIYEKTDTLGGMVRNALPLFRLNNDIVEQDIKRILKLGIKVHYNTEIDKDAFIQLQNKHKYIFIATGSFNFVKLKIEGINAKGVYDPLLFFYKSRTNPKSLNLGKKIGIIGGGNTAIDAARIAKRIAGKDSEVVIFYRRRYKDMPAYEEEIFEALNEGIKIIELVSPTKIITDENNKVKAIKLIKNQVIGKTSDGRTLVAPIEGSEFIHQLDSLIPTVGQKPDSPFFPDTYWVENTLPKTILNNIFIGGDAPRGGKSIIVSIADGKKAAYQIIKKENPDFKPTKFKIQKKINIKQLKLAKYKRIPPIKPPESKILDFNIKLKTYSPEEAKAEAERCMLCDEYCSVCTTVCPNLANQTYITEPRKIPIYTIFKTTEGFSIVIDEYFEIKQKYQTFNIADWCNECGNCSTFCPTSGKPYIDKPKIHLSITSFEQSPWGFYKNFDELIYKDKFGEKHSLTKTKNYFIYKNKNIEALIDIENENIIEINTLKVNKITLNELPILLIVYDIFEKYNF